MKKYSESFLAGNNTVNKICKDIAIYNIATRSGLEVEENEIYAIRYTNAIKLLDKLARGIVELSGVSSETIKSSVNFVSLHSSKKLFGRENLKGM